MSDSQPVSDTENLLSKLTLDEKLALLGGAKGKAAGNIGGGGTHAIERVGLPMFRLADGPAGVHWWCKASTAYPVPVMLAASWDADLARRFGEAIGRDCRARGVHILLAPGVNIYRSPLCGRNFEYLGEDPTLASRMVVPVIEGVQSREVAATVKHFAVNFQEYDRNHVSSDLDERTLREIYLPAFEAAVREARVGAVMGGYNLVNGEHCSQHDWLNNHLLKGEWGFEGVLMSDWESTYDGIGAALGGLDLEMPRAKMMTPETLKNALAAGIITQETIDAKIRRLLSLAERFHWLEREQQDEAIPLDDPASAECALEMARQGCVLLKNERDFLPIEPASLKKVAVIGYQGHPAVICGGGSAYTRPFREVSVRDGLRAVLPERGEIVESPGYTPEKLETVGRRPIFTRENGEPGVFAEYWSSPHFTGEPSQTQVQDNMFVMWGGGKPVKGWDSRTFATRWTGWFTAKDDGLHTLHVNTSGKITVKLDDDVVAFREATQEIGRYFEAPLRLEAGRRYRLVVECEIPDWIYNMLQIGISAEAEWQRWENEAVHAAEGADLVLFCAGYSSSSESEGFDREFELPAGQTELLRRIAEVNDRLTVLLFSGGGVDFEPWLDQVPALLQVWYPGQEGGRAIAEILTGQVNPSGKLPMTFDRALSERSSHDNYHDTTGTKRVRITDGVFTGYRHNDREEIEPRFPFGHGLSYTRFALGEPEVAADRIEPGEPLEIIVPVTNTGSVAGAEVVQCYVGEVEPAPPRPVRELKAFAKIFLAPGETGSVKLVLGEEAWRYWCPDRKGWTANSGEFRVWIGTSSRDLSHCLSIIRGTPERES